MDAALLEGRGQRERGSRANGTYSEGHGERREKRGVVEKEQGLSL